MSLLINLLKALLFQIYLNLKVFRRNQEYLYEENFPVGFQYFF